MSHFILTDALQHARNIVVSWDKWANRPNTVEPIGVAVARALLAYHKHQSQVEASLRRKLRNVRKALRDYGKCQRAAMLEWRAERSCEIQVTKGTEMEIADSPQSGLTDLLVRLRDYILTMAPHHKQRLQGQLLIEARDGLRSILSADDPRILRIARALAEGCDGRSFSSDDAKWLCRRYEKHKSGDPPASFADARDRAFADFIVWVLGS